MLNNFDRAVFLKIWRLISPRERRRAVVIIILMLFGAVFESFGLGMMLPLIGLMTSPDVIMDNQVAQTAASIIGTASAETFFFVLLGAFIFLFVLSLGYRLWLSWQQVSFLNDLRTSISTQLFEAYLHQPWSFHVDRHSSILTQNVIKEVDLLSQYAFAGLLNFVREGLMMFVMISMLLYLAPIPALASMAILVPLGWLMQRVSRMRINRWALVRQDEEVARLKSVQEGLAVVRELKLLGKESAFLKRFSKHNELLLEIERMQSFMRQISRPIFELSAIIGISAGIFVMWITGVPFTQMAPMLALFAVAAIRLLPSMNQVLVALHGIRYVSPVLNTISDEIHRLSHHVVNGKVELLPFHSSIELSEVCYSYPGSITPLFDRVSLSIPHGAFVALVGGTGSGKSTLVDLILGLIRPTTGRLVIDGVDAQSNIQGWQRQIGYVGQNIVLIDDTLRRNIALGVADHEIDDEKIWKALEAAQIFEYVRQLPQQLDTMIGERGAKLSGGERQRIGIARALYLGPTVLILDEATSALDEASERQVMVAIERLRGNNTIIMITHRLATIKFCDAVFHVSAGSVSRADAPNAFAGFVADDK